MLQILSITPFEKIPMISSLPTATRRNDDNKKNGKQYRPDFLHRPV